MTRQLDAAAKIHDKRILGSSSSPSPHALPLSKNGASGNVYIDILSVYSYMHTYLDYADRRWKNVDKSLLTHKCTCASMSYQANKVYAAYEAGDNREPRNSKRVFFQRGGDRARTAGGRSCDRARSNIRHDQFDNDYIRKLKLMLVPSRTELSNKTRQKQGSISYQKTVLKKLWRGIS